MATVKTYDFGKTRITLVWKYRYSKNKETLDSFIDWRDWRIAIWFKRNKMVGKKHFNRPKDWNANLVNDYMLGFDLLIFKGWINWSTGGMHLEIK